jgi:hypothetical protein
LTLTVTTDGSELLETRRDSDDELAEIRQLGEAHGVRPEDFHVKSLKISYGYNEERRRFFYEVDRSAQMTLNDIGRFDALLAAALKRGGFNITGIQFSTSRGEELRSEARRRAVAAARDRASEMAALNGLELGKAIAIRSSGMTQRPFVTSVLPVVGQRNPIQPGHADPFGGGGMFSLPSRKSPPALDPSLQWVSFADEQNGGDGTKSRDVRDVAAGLGVIDTSVSVTIDFELLDKSPKQE